MKSTFSVKQINLTGEGVPYLQACYVCYHKYYPALVLNSSHPNVQYIVRVVRLHVAGYCKNLRVYYRAARCKTCLACRQYHVPYIFSSNMNQVPGFLACAAEVWMDLQTNLPSQKGLPVCMFECLFLAHIYNMCTVGIGGHSRVSFALTASSQNGSHILQQCKTLKYQRNSTHKVRAIQSQGVIWGMGLGRTTLHT